MVAKAPAVGRGMLSERLILINRPAQEGKLFAGARAAAPFRAPGLWTPHRFRHMRLGPRWRGEKKTGAGGTGSRGVINQNGGQDCGARIPPPPPPTLKRAL